jgi:Coenzyme PQQ synthesis protein D (PqqD)
MGDGAVHLVTNPTVLAQKTEDGAVLVETTTGDCFELNQLGAEIWAAIGKGDPLPQIVEALAKRYQVQTATIETDTRTLVEELAQRGLLVPRR